MDRRKALKQVRNTLSDHISVKTVSLYGSRARGGYRPDSDWDIAVISPDFHDMPFHERQKLVRPVVREALGGNVSLDVACYTQDEYDEGIQKQLLPAIIEETGVKA